MKLLVGSFTATMGSLPDKHDMVSGILPPLSLAEGELDLEFSLLLAFDALVFDRYSVERLESYDNPGIQRITRSLRILEDAGFLILENFRAKVTSARSFLNRGIDAAAHDSTIWLPHLKNEVTEYDYLLPKMKEMFGSVLSAWDDHTFGIASYLLASTGRVDHESAREIRHLVMGTNRRRRRSVDNELIRNVLRPVVENVYANLYLAEEYDCVPYGWGTLSGFYDQALLLAARNVQAAGAEMEQCRRFFGLAFREFRPRTAADWVKLLKNPRLKELRERIKQAIHAEENIDERYAQRALAELQRTEGYLRRYKTYSARIAASASIVVGTAGGILGGMIGGIAGSAAPVLVQEGVDILVERRTRKRHAWLYFTSDKAQGG